MMRLPVLARLKAEGRNVYLRVLKWVNNTLTGLFGAISAAYAAYPHSVGDFLEKLPKWVLFPAAVAVFWFIRSVISKANTHDKATTQALNEVQNGGQDPAA